VVGLEVPEDLKEQIANAVQRQEVAVVNSTVLHRHQRFLALVTGNTGTALISDMLWISLKRESRSSHLEVDAMIQSDTV
jgi:hypothetical protein